jgi:glycosyltransferase involved in cell wall biosynthesis
MKLIYISNARLPTEKAHGLQVMSMCEAFARSGADVELVIPRRLNPLRDDPFEYYGVERLFEITRLPTLDTVRFGKFGYLIQVLTFAEFAFWYLLFKKADIIYSRDEIPLFDLSIVKRNLIWETHRGSYNVFARFVLARCKKIVTISQGLKDFYQSNGIDEERMIVAHDGLNLEKFSQRWEAGLKQKVQKRLGMRSEKSVVMYAGRIDGWKGIDTLLSASLELPNDFQVVVIGGEDDQVIEYRKKYPNVIFAGYLPYRDLPKNQQGADVLVVPNTAKGEISRLFTSPLKVFAHMASSIPIVASDLPSIREVLNEKNAYMVKPDNPKELARAIIEAVTNTDGSEKKARVALRDVGDFTWLKRAGYILSEIQK